MKLTAFSSFSHSVYQYATKCCVTSQEIEYIGRSIERTAKSIVIGAIQSVPINNETSTVVLETKKHTGIVDIRLFADYFI